ncbi:hypothetical protein [Thermocoleostomius sinensis]|uniref:Uncharacterized protein n=1 Tax=Thermocoleostomius sinensis A174 TaxID=2016057 RepID=A0A9E8ZK14_9CYAN|nr:hypothetical protein [Thermocoleostomius sinensis]WAL59921.1 hypothetical protein OXH18_22555 [Thermocoleostomius sinensis A174]
MNNQAIGLRIVSVLVLTGFSLVGAPVVEDAAIADETTSKLSLLQLLSPHSIHLEELSPEEIAYIEAMQEHSN